jgi:hypothetical protein
VTNSTGTLRGNLSLEFPWYGQPPHIAYDCLLFQLPCATKLADLATYNHRQVKRVHHLCRIILCHAFSDIIEPDKGVVINI